MIGSTAGATVAAAVQGIKVSVVMAYSNKPLYDLVVQPEISSYAELKGKIFGLGSLTGFAYDIPRLLLSRNGVDPKQDIKMISIGLRRVTDGRPKSEQHPSDIARASLHLYRRQRRVSQARLQR